jgi:crotonobetainyl-CoA:carnitine CoA-transferase CaiB-like acyl-CoA transferase
MQEDESVDRFRVLELTSPVTAATGRLLADAGAEVIKVERPGARAPAGGMALAQRLYQDTDKKSLTLDLESQVGRELLTALIADVDIVLESGRPGWMASLGLSYPTLADRDPAVTVVSITPFGQTGPYAHYVADDFVAFAMGGVMFISGTPDRPPVVAPCEQAWMTAAVHAAGGALAGWWAAAETGYGEWVDVSVVECLAAQECTVTNFRGADDFTRRMGSQHRTALPGRIFPCKDGFIHVFVNQERATWERFLAWSGSPPELSVDLAEINLRWRNAELVDMVTERFLARHTRDELWESGQRHHLPVAPVLSVEEVLRDTHLQHLDIMQPADAETPSAAHYRTLMPALRRGQARLPRRPAPEPGADSAMVLTEMLGLTAKECTGLREEGIV